MNQPIDSLALISLKCAPNVFDLSSGLTHVSIRDQVVRAEILIRDLAAAGVPFQRLIVVGAGVAGIAAALAAGRLGKDVTVLETKHDLFDLQYRANKRYIGPFMYEWPSIFFSPQDFPPQKWPRYALPPSQNSISFTWRSRHPISGHEFAKKMRKSVKKQLKKWSLAIGAAPLIFTQVKPAQVEAWVKDFIKNGVEADPPPLDGVNWMVPNVGTKLDWKLPDFIILAAGMGPEILKLEGLDCVSFWADDTLCDDTSSAKNIAIVGGGDGALQDVLRSLTGQNHPLLLVKQLVKNRKVAMLLKQQNAYLLSLENQSRNEATWTIDRRVFSHIDSQCSALASDLAKNVTMCNGVANLLRNGTGSVHLFVREAYFSKAYLLNRFLVHLILACKQNPLGNFANKMDFKVHWETNVTATTNVSSSNASITTLDIEKNEAYFDFQLWAIRFGPDVQEASGYKMIALTPNACPSRTILSQIPLPYYINQ